MEFTVREPRGNVVAATITGTTYRYLSYFFCGFVVERDDSGVSAEPMIIIFLASALTRWIETNQSNAKDCFFRNSVIISCFEIVSQDSMSIEILDSVDARTKLIVPFPPQTIRLV